MATKKAAPKKKVYPKRIVVPVGKQAHIFPESTLVFSIDADGERSRGLEELLRQARDEAYENGINDAKKPCFSDKQLSPPRSLSVRMQAAINDLRELSKNEQNQYIAILVNELKQTRAKRAEDLNKHIKNLAEDVIEAEKQIEALDNILNGGFEKIQIR